MSKLDEGVENSWFLGRTVKTSPATTTTSGLSAMIRSMAVRKVAATSASRWLTPPG